MAVTTTWNSRTRTSTRFEGDGGAGVVCGRMRAEGGGRGSGAETLSVEVCESGSRDGGVAGKLGRFSACGETGRKREVYMAMEQGGDLEESEGVVGRTWLGVRVEGPWVGCP